MGLVDCGKKMGLSVCNTDKLPQPVCFQDCVFRIVADVLMAKTLQYYCTHDVCSSSYVSEFNNFLQHELDARRHLLLSNYAAYF